ncbi:putative LPS assembly protein LptD [Aureibaculum sp. 2210JD6-5]|uniref:putative LPS assembly protein LptD n=1 Tax=Aureibaculum sp. 2210JD6-5 TaxID=3103957 RepID=UPI002AAEDAA6|nr:putative LPS assembly protein LptD [Aureibaculum sp. 2210JD6-5]MDY7393785.1 putative LPS assembly protein LptD [Aureibaculum sp. 2210JD6-5]
MQSNFKYIVFVFLFLGIGCLSINAQITTQKRDSLEPVTNKIIGLKGFSFNDTIQLPDVANLKPIDTTKIDSITPKEFLDAEIIKKATDYIKNDFVNNRTILYNNAEIYYQDIELKAGIIEIDQDKNLAYAKGIIDSTGAYIQKPQFKQAGQESEQDSLVYNFKNEKAIIYNTKTVQEGVIVRGEITKRENDSVFYLDKAHFTTSTKEKPDYEIVTRNIKLVPGKKIVGGRSQLKLADVPTPAILPFFYVPLTKERSVSGFLIPTWGENSNQGFFLQNGGYYFAINDYVDLAVLGDVYTNGSWGMRFESNYAVRYRFSGNFSLRFENLITGQRGFSNFNKRNNFYVRWSHSPSQQASPNSRFSVSVNLGSSKYFQESLNEYNISQQVTNTFNSSINYYKKFVGTPFNMNIGLTHSQNTNTEKIDMTLPSLQIGMDRIYPFAPKSGAKKNPIQSIGLSYNFDAQNRISTDDDKFLKPGMFKDARSGAKHTVSASTNMKALKYITLSPSVNYNEVWYLKTVDQRYNDELDQIERDTINKFDAFREYSGGVSASTTLYGMFNFKKGRLQAIRHVMRPSVSFNYRPDFSFYYDEVQQSDDPNDLREFSRFDGGVYGAPSRGLSSSIGLSLNNTFEAKMMSKDSTATEPEKIKLLNNLNFSTSYNIVADSLNWSPVRMTAGTTILDNKLSLNASATLDPYALSASGRRINTFNVNNGGSLFRLTQANMSASYSISSDIFAKKEPKDKNAASSSGTEGDEESLFGSDLTTRNTADDQDESKTKVAKLYGATLPWKLSLRYNVGYSNSTRQNEISNNSLQFSGNVELSPKWSVGLSSGYDFKNKGITFTNLSFERDLDSWRMSFNWVPFGNSTTYYFFIGIKSSVLSDIKYDKRKVPDRRLF